MKREIVQGILAMAILCCIGLGDMPRIQSEQELQTKKMITYVPKESIEENKELIGEFTVTAYCPCEVCCGEWSNLENPITASGESAKEGITVGADWNTLPEGTDIMIESVGKRIVQDKPADWIVQKYEGKILDLYFETHEDALKFGKQKLNVYEVVK